jgi:hypothetical protein
MGRSRRAAGGSDPPMDYLAPPSQLSSVDPPIQDYPPSPGRLTVGATMSTVACTCSYTWGIGLEQPTEIRRPALNCPVHPMPVTAGACPGCGTSITVLLGGPPC